MCVCVCVCVVRERESARMHCWCTCVLCMYHILCVCISMCTMYVCIHVCIHVCIMQVHVYVSCVCTCVDYACIYVCMYLYRCAWECGCRVKQWLYINNIYTTLMEERKEVLDLILELPKLKHNLLFPVLRPATNPCDLILIVTFI